MGLLDELKKLTKPYDEDYLEEDLEEPVRVAPRQSDPRSYTAYAEPPRQEAQPQAPRRPYAFSGQSRQQSGGYAEDPYARQNPYAQNAYAAPNGYGASYAQGGGYSQPGYAQQNAYGRSAYTPNDSPFRGATASSQAKLLLVRPDRFEVAADIADRIQERNAIVLNLEGAPKETSRRILDFLSGVTYALGGKVKKVAGNTYIITPDGMEFMGDGLEDMESRDNYF